MSIPVALVFLHVVLINSDTSVFLPLKVWILTLIAISLVAGFYRRLLYSILAAHYSYVVSNIELAADIGVINITLSPLGEQKPMDHKPGDFVYIRFSNKQVGGEKHPFSISSYPGTNEMRLTIKMTGDFTRRLKHLKVGDKTTLWGPHGGFADAYHSNKQDQVWIAGGIGVTPFLSILPCEVQQQRQRISRINREVNFYYCVNTLPEAAFKDEIQQQCINAPSIMFRPFITQINGWLTAERIVADIGDKIFTSKIFLCGPQVMMESLTKQLNKVGVKNKQIFFENFSFVS
jgi:predicted ferric reductase